MANRAAAALTCLVAVALTARGAAAGRRVPRCTGAGIQLTLCLVNGGGVVDVGAGGAGAAGGLQLGRAYSPAFGNYVSGIAPGFRTVGFGGVPAVPQLGGAGSAGGVGLHQFVGGHSGAAPSFSQQGVSVVGGGGPALLHGSSHTVVTPHLQPAVLQSGPHQTTLIQQAAPQPAAQPLPVQHLPAHPLPVQPLPVQPLPAQPSFVPSPGVAQQVPIYGRGFNYAYSTHGTAGGFAGQPQLPAVGGPQFSSGPVQVPAVAQPAVPVPGPQQVPAVHHVFSSTHHASSQPAGVAHHFQSAAFPVTTAQQTPFQPRPHVWHPSVGTGLATQPDIRSYYQSAQMVGRGSISVTSGRAAELICDFTVNGPYPSSDILTDVVWQRMDSPTYLNTPMASGSVFSNNLSCPNTYITQPHPNYGFNIHGTRTSLSIAGSTPRDYGVYRCYATRVNRLNPNDRAPVYMEIHFTPNVFK